MFSNEKVARDWLAKQMNDYPNGYYQEVKARIERVPALIEYKEGQVDLFDLLAI